MTLDRLTEYLRAATARGELRCRRPARAAKLFLGAVIANYRVLALINPPKTPIAEIGNSRPRARRGRDVPGLLRAQAGAFGLTGKQANLARSLFPFHGERGRGCCQ